MSRVIFGSANHWTSPYQVGSHAWARLFAGHGWETLYVSDPVTPWHWLSSKARPRAAERFDLWKKGGAVCEGERLRTWVPRSLVAPHESGAFRGRSVLDGWSRFTIPSVVSRVRSLGFDRPDVFWIDSVRHAAWGARLHPSFTVLRVADWSAGFQRTPRAALVLERELISSADLVIAAAETLRERILPLRKGGPVQTIRNGVDVAFWNAVREPPPEYARIPAPRILYVGAVDDWFDLPLLTRLARRFPGCSFVMVGQPRVDVSGSPSNVYWLGTRDRHSARAYVRHAHVGIIPFKRSELIDSVCPLKLYEYMACGLPVVATRWTELERMDSPARLASTEGEWAAAIERLIADPPATPSEVRDRSAKSEEIKFALANDWTARWAAWMRSYAKAAGSAGSRAV